jgi:hypothetical protein
VQLANHTEHHYQPKTKYVKTGVVLHHTATSDMARSPAKEYEHIEAIATWHKTKTDWKKWSFDFGYHYIIFPSGRSYHVGANHTSRAHAKGTDHRGTKWNQSTIGVAIVGDYTTKEPTREAIAAATALVDHLGLPLIGGHKNLKGNENTTCPGNWNYMGLLSRPLEWDAGNSDDWGRLVEAVARGHIEPFMKQGQRDRYIVTMRQRKG